MYLLQIITDINIHLSHLASEIVTQVQWSAHIASYDWIMLLGVTSQLCGCFTHKVVTMCMQSIPYNSLQKSVWDDVEHTYQLSRWLPSANFVIIYIKIDACVTDTIMSFYYSSNQRGCLDVGVCLSYLMISSCLLYSRSCAASICQRLCASQNFFSLR